MYKKYFKRVMDFVLSLMAIIVLSPVLLIVAVLVRTKLGSPVFFKQERPGKDEKIFKLYKFRTMTDEKDEHGELLPDEVRLTKFGKMLRSTSLDELPELFNILKGDMSIIGPRPLLVEYLTRYNAEQKRRHEVRPGLSGLAQVNGRNSISWEDKFKYDVEYIEHVTFLGDWKIIFQTVLNVLKRDGISSETSATMEDFYGTLQEEGMEKMSVETPYFEINLQELEKNYIKLVEALENNWSNYIIGYSYKTNALPWIVKFFQDKGCYAEVVSEDEYELSKLVNTEQHKCIYNGPIKTKDSFLEALQNGCIVNIDSQREVEWLKDVAIKETCNVGVRVNFDVEEVCIGQTACGDEGGRFGFCYENGELKKVIEKIRECGISIKGLHMHISSKTRSIEIYETIAKKACEIAETYSLELSYVDIGGGFFGGLANKPQFSEYLAVIKEQLEKKFNPENTTLIIEPGMCLVGSAINYVTSVIDVKDTTYNRFVITDGSRTNIDPLMKKSNYFFYIEQNSESNRKMSKQVICGFTCMEPDRIMILNDYPELNVGDRIVYEKVGAYTMCLTPLFIKYFPEVYVRDKNELNLVRKKWTVAEYIQGNV